MYEVNIKAREKSGEVSESLYGLFFEDINRGGDGGLYAELLRNRAFDDGVIPESCTYDGKRKIIVSPTGWESSFDCFEGEKIAAWEAAEGAEMWLTDEDTLNPSRKRALKVRLNGGTVRNVGFMGVPVESGKSYRFYMFAKAESAISVKIALTSTVGVEYASESFTVEGGYSRYGCMLESTVTDFNARLAVSSGSSEVLTVGFTSLFPTDTYMNRENGLRRLSVEKMLKLNPKFLRFPGGCIVEGFTKETAYRFKDGIGPVWERKPHWLLWSYNTTNGLGFHEYLQFCEDAGLDAMYVVNCGMTCQGRMPDYFDDALVEEMYEDAVQAILYATDPADSEWGAKRAANGHPEPFEALKYIEIGNENWGEEYYKRYKLFYERLKERFPQFAYIATDHTERAGLPADIVDEHFYSSPNFFASQNCLYDDLAADSPDIYIGEFAATMGCREGTLQGALAEAAFLTGVERNQHKVKMLSYAPLFRNVDYTAWEPDLINFDNHDCYVTPSYYVLEMFGGNRGTHVCKCDVVTDGDLHGYVPETYSSTSNGEFNVRFRDNDETGEDQHHCDWTVEGGKSRVTLCDGWSTVTLCESACSVLTENRYLLSTNGDGFIAELNGEIVHRHMLKPIPHLTAAAAIDEKHSRLILKIVNITERDLKVHITADIPLGDIAELTLLTADGLRARNSLSDKYAAAPRTETIPFSSDFELTVRPRSVNVIRARICDGK